MLKGKNWKEKNRMPPSQSHIEIFIRIRIAKWKKKNIVGSNTVILVQKHEFVRFTCQDCDGVYCDWWKEVVEIRMIRITKIL